MDPSSIDLGSIPGGSEQQQHEDGAAAAAGSPKEVFRSQQSLGLITQRFMSLRQRNEVLNLNEVAKELNISKRRVYDVINVLEGLGYVEKVEKNNIRWIGDNNNSEEQNALEARVEMLRQQEKLLELMIRDAQAIIELHFEDPIERPYNYVSKEDIRKTAEPNTKSIIVKSELDTSSSFEIQVTDPSTSGSHDMIVRNKNGVKSHALLFTNDPPEYGDEEDEDDVKKLSSQKRFETSEALRVTLAEMLTDPTTISSSPKHIKLEEPEEIDTEDLETFAPPEFSENKWSQKIGGGLAILWAWLALMPRPQNGNFFSAKFFKFFPETVARKTFVLPPSTSASQSNAPYLPETPGRGLFFSPFKSLIDPCILPSFSDDLTSGYINITTPSRATGAGAGASGQEDEEPVSVMDFFSD
eukprot:NP_496825.3 E2F-like (mammalian transcription factor) [Caenorhabditis elegans]